MYLGGNKTTLVLVALPYTPTILLFYELLFQSQIFLHHVTNNNIHTGFKYRPFE